jgi:dTDP-glucose 4,6-dehydratase
VNTHGIDAVVTRCSNNYGPRQFPEKFVPLMIANALEDRRLPPYGDGLYERDWIFVDDHCDALLTVLAKGRTGTVYNVAGATPKSNLDVAHGLLDALGKPRALVEHVRDRPGHDRRYAPDGTRLATELGWRPRRRFDEAMHATIAWYRENTAWLDHVRSGAYREYYARHYGRGAAAE